MSDLSPSAITPARADAAQLPPPASRLAAVLAAGSAHAAELRAMGPGEPYVFDSGGFLGARRTLGSVHVVADARLDDRDRLLAALRISAHEGRTLEDTGLILRAYLAWGAACAEHLVGAFAFVVWDERRGSLLAARDHMGFRPLHWRYDGTRLIIASWAEGVLGHPAVGRWPNATAITAVETGAYPLLLEQSLFSGVHKLRPGGFLVAHPGRSPWLSRYWRPGPRPAAALADPHECVRAVRDAVGIAVADAVREAQPTGAHLSGGLDSSTIAVLADRELRQRHTRLQRGYAWSPSPDAVQLRSADDERLRIAMVADSIDLPMRFVGPTVEHAKRLERIHAALRPSQMMLLEADVQEDAAAAGLRLLLSGWGGDEVASFNGRGWIAGLLGAGKPGVAAQEAWEMTKRRAPRLRGRCRMTVQFLYQEGVRPYLPDRALMARESGSPVTLVQRRAAVLGSRDRPGVHATQSALLDFGHLAHRIETWAWWGDRLGLSYRYPLLDRRVIDLCLSLPEGLWWHEGERRWLFRRVADGILPAGVPSSPVKQEAVLAEALRTATAQFLSS